MFLVVFIHDILIYFQSEEEHIEHLRVLLKILRKERLFGKFVKCVFLLKEVIFLRYMDLGDGIKVDPKKAKMRINWPRPLTTLNIRSLKYSSPFYQLQLG